ncbi:glycoside hydrolase family 30 beta sandwich domain-containing protein [Mesobacillus subterraneus]|uniref:glycoside hydrolase family 30 beta sandwich domain-containing protein n=1 Tax=Mesobacillus subterraneus TaxID=285983 RepID=UPI0027402D32|nr:glycoside hydrolase family 30 beta sandwich domain-containing protein [Mesobacillus subterraneus]WLR54808.1 glycoside hydrolase family 30 beta sandwich domain-containing protein [Mesobacillus subterraneus]
MDDFYTIGHASKFVQPKAKRIESSQEGSIENVVLKNPDGSKVLIAYNHGNSNEELIVSDQGNFFSYSLPEGAAATFVWNS